MKKLVLILLFNFLILNLFAQIDSAKAIQNKRKIVFTSAATFYVGLYTSLGVLWYGKEKTSPFHFFNDNKEWMQVDKMGHALSAYELSDAGVKTMLTLKYPKQKAYLLGSLTGVIFQTPIEIFDGFMEDYGASVGDAVANASGSALCYTQYLLWDEIRIQPKFSFKQTNFRDISPRPNLLGSSWTDQWLKDYNGQTYWLSFNISQLSNNKIPFPKWLNVAIGTGASKRLTSNFEENTALGYRPYRRYSLSLDVDFRAIPTKNPFLKKLFNAVNYLKVPFPTLQYSSKHGFEGTWY